MNRHEAIQFLRRFSRQEQIPTEEKESFLAWLHEQDEEVIEEIAREYESIIHQTNFHGLVDEMLADRIEKRLDELDARKTSIPVRKMSLLATRWMRYAAVVFLLLSGAVLIWLFRQTSVPQLAEHPPVQAADDIMPGADRAVLTLADGTSIILDSAANGSLAEQGNTRIIKLNTGMLAYKSEQGAAIGYNTITTPRGGQYQIILPDGTGVWLNAASSVRFPTSFTGPKRTVEISGEAYLEVKSMPERPFTVITSGAEVVVLGTKFNVNDYTDEPLIKVALAEGKVQLKQESQSAMLNPGQMGMVYRNNAAGSGGSISVRNANISDETAWKSGLFVFNDAPIESIMRQLARWYDLDVVFKGKVATTFLATIPKRVPLSQVLEALELTKAVHFKRVGREVTVMP